VGTPIVHGARVLAEVLEHGRDKKILVFKYKNKTRYRRRFGHRQDFTRLAIRQILTEGQQAVVATAKPKRPARKKAAIKAEEPVVEAAQTAAIESAPAEAAEAPTPRRARAPKPKAEIEATPVKAAEAPKPRSARAPKPKAERALEPKATPARTTTRGRRISNGP